MVEFKSKEEDEAAWGRIKKLETRCDVLDKKFIEYVRCIAISGMNSLGISLIFDKSDYMINRIHYYNKRINECTDDLEMAEVMKKFIEEYKTYKVIK